MPVAPSAPVVLGPESSSIAPLLQIPMMQRSAVPARLDRPPRISFPG
jgi:hypothetical protein